MKQKRPEPTFKTMVRLKDGSAVPYEALNDKEKCQLANILNEKIIRCYAREIGCEVSITYKNDMPTELDYIAIKERAKANGFAVEEAPENISRGTA